MLSVDLFMMSKSFKKFAPDPSIKMRNRDRLMGIFLWPIMFSIFLFSFIMAWVRHVKRPPHKTKEDYFKELKKNKRKKKKK